MLGRRRACAGSRHRLRVEVRAKRHAPAIGCDEQTFISDEKDFPPEVGADGEFSELFSGFHRPDDGREQVCRRQHGSASVEDELTRRRVGVGR
jgi:hypothetical protein